MPELDFMLCYIITFQIFYTFGVSLTQHGLMLTVTCREKRQEQRICEGQKAVKSGQEEQSWLGGAWARDLGRAVIGSSPGEATCGWSCEILGGHFCSSKNYIWISKGRATPKSEGLKLYVIPIGSNNGNKGGDGWGDIMRDGFGDIVWEGAGG